MMILNDLHAATGKNTSVSEPAASQSSQQFMPISEFIVYAIPGDGDCLFRSFLMGSDENPGHLASPGSVMELRGRLSDYLSTHYETLAKNDTFGGGNILADLYQLLVTPHS